MPFRSPKMYFAIFGFQRLVWWPKWTPASRSSFMVICAIAGYLRSVCLRAPCGLRSSRRPPPTSERVCGGLARSGVYLNVVRREVAGPDVILRGAEAQVDRDRDLGLGQLRLHPVPAHAVAQPAPGGHLLLPVPDPDPILLDRDACRAERRHDATPVRVAPGHGRLEQVRVRDGARR